MATSDASRRIQGGLSVIGMIVRRSMKQNPDKERNSVKERISCCSRLTDKQLETTFCCTDPSPSARAPVGGLRIAGGVCV